MNTPITLDGGEADGQPAIDWQGETDEDADDQLAKKREKAKNGGKDTMIGKMKLVNGPVTMMMVAMIMHMP